MMMEKVKKDGNEVIIAGGGRHDSMGHSAKFCSYSIFCCNLPMIIHFDIVQVNMNFSNTLKCTNVCLGTLLLLSMTNKKFFSW